MEPIKKNHPPVNLTGGIFFLFSCKNALLHFDPFLFELNFDLRFPALSFADLYLSASLTYIVHWILPPYIFFVKVTR